LRATDPALAAAPQPGGDRRPRTVDHWVTERHDGADLFEAREVLAGPDHVSRVRDPGDDCGRQRPLDIEAHVRFDQWARLVDRHETVRRGRAVSLDDVDVTEHSRPTEAAVLHHPRDDGRDHDGSHVSG